METKQANRHLGRKIGRIREMMGVKQDSLAEQLGITQQAVNKLEQSEDLENTILERIAKALHVSPEAIKNFNDESVVFHIENLNDQSSAYTQYYNFQGTSNPIDKWLEAIEENKRLYEALLKAEREKIAILEKMLNK